MTKTIALFGGSFNPPHEGHIAMASYIHNTLKVDETWLLFSESPQKDPAAYVSLKHRMNMADILIRNCDTPIILSDFEAKIDEQENQHQTYHVLNKIYSTYPEYKFIFTMGSDNFATLHSWHAWEKLMQSS